MKTLKETSGNTPLGLYVHVPFCTKKCPYCHFYVLPNGEKRQLDFHGSLCQELALYRDYLGDFPIKSLYFGGGTPSLYEGIADFLDELNPPSDIEITIEANPEDVSLEKMESFKHLGINRVSLGVQSLLPDELVLLGRTHSASRAVDAVWETYTAGITNISIDILFELPYQTREKLLSTFEVLKTLPITHLSFYNLTFEPHTAFMKQREALKPHLPNENEAAAMHKEATLLLEQMGLHRYEISAYAKKGYQAQHNIGYWKGTPFIGLGPSAFSYLGGARFSNIKNLSRYGKALSEEIFPIDFIERLPYEDALAEKLAVALRLHEGVNITTFPDIPPSLNKKIAGLIEEGLLSFCNTQLTLTEKGRLFYDTVGAGLI